MKQDTSMLRVNKEYKAMLKDYAEAEGRTLEWCTDKAVEQFVFEHGIDKDREEKKIIKRAIVTEGVVLGLLSKAALPIAEDKSMFARSETPCKSCETPLRPDHKCQVKGCKLFGKVQ